MSAIHPKAMMSTINEIQNSKLTRKTRITVGIRFLQPQPRANPKTKYTRVQKPKTIPNSIEESIITVIPDRKVTLIATWYTCNANITGITTKNTIDANGITN